MYAVSTIEWGNVNTSSQDEFVEKLRKFGKLGIIVIPTIDTQKNYLFYPVISALRHALAEVYKTHNSDLLWNILYKSSNLPFNRMDDRDNVFFQDIRQVVPRDLQRVFKMDMGIFRLKELLMCTPLADSVGRIALLDVANAQILSLFNTPRVSILVQCQDGHEYAVCIKYTPVRREKLDLDLTDLIYERVYISNSLAQQGIEEVFKYLADGCGQVGEFYKRTSEYKPTSASACYRCIVHKECNKFIHVTWKNQKSNPTDPDSAQCGVYNLEASIQGSHSNEFDSDAFWGRVVEDNYKDGEARITLFNRIEGKFANLAKQGFVPPIPELETIKRLARNKASRNRTADRNFDLLVNLKQNMLAVSDIYDDTEKKHVFLAHHTCNENNYEKFGIYFFSKTVVRVLKLLIGTGIKTKTGFADATFKCINAATQVAVRKDEGKRLLLAHFGIDMPTFKNKDIVMKYVPIVFVLANTESTWMYNHLFEYAFCVFHIAGIKITNRDYMTASWIQDKLCGGFLLSQKEKLKIIEIANTKTTHDLQINILVSDFAKAIQKANTDTLRSNHMGDFVHVLRNFMARLQSDLNDDKSKFEATHRTLKMLMSMLRLSRSNAQHQLILIVMEGYMRFHKLDATFKYFKDMYLGETNIPWRYDSYGLKGSLCQTSHVESSHNALNINKFQGNTTNEKKKLFHVMLNITQTASLVMSEINAQTHVTDPQKSIPEYVIQMAMKAYFGATSVSDVIIRRNKVFVNNGNVLDSKADRVGNASPESNNMGYFGQYIDEHRVDQLTDTLSGRIAFNGYHLSTLETFVTRVRNESEWNNMVSELKRQSFGLNNIMVGNSNTQKFSDVSCPCEEFRKHNVCPCALVYALKNNMDIIHGPQFQKYKISKVAYKVGEEVFVPSEYDHKRFDRMVLINKARKSTISAYYMDENKIMLIKTIKVEDGSLWCYAKECYKDSSGTIREKGYIEEKWDMANMSYDIIFEYMEKAQEYNVKMQPTAEIEKLKLPVMPKKTAKISSVDVLNVTVSLSGTENSYTLSKNYLAQYMDEHIAERFKDAADDDTDSYSSQRKKRIKSKTH